MEPMATIDIHISGMCLFVPDPDGLGDRTGDSTAPPSGTPLLHVLMPSSGGGSGPDHADHPGAHAVEKHEAVLLYDEVYQGGTGPGRRWRRLDLDGAVWSFGISAGPSLDVGQLDALRHDDQIVDATTLNRGRVARSLVQGPANGRLAARVVIDRGVYGGSADAVAWDVDYGASAPYRGDLTSLAFWQVPDALAPGAQLAILRNGETVKHLTPHGGNIVLEILHVPSSELPPQFGDPPRHYHGYLPLLEGPVAKAPRYVGKVARGVNPAMCLVARAELSGA